MTTIILTHWHRFGHLASNYGTDIAPRVVDALNSLPRREAFRWLMNHFEGNPDAITEGEVNWDCLEFTVYYDRESRKFYCAF
jgi:hypothetical protein